jgi:UDP-N-acetylglucosamine 2-epimerase (non-hydrolysing)
MALIMPAHKEEAVMGDTLESLVAEQVYVTGNTVIEALLSAVERARSLSPPVPRTRPRRILLTLHRRESHGQAMRNVCDVVAKLVRRGDAEVVFPVHRSPAVREVVVPALAGVDGVHLCEPLDYLAGSVEHRAA